MANILVVDDDESIRFALEETLTRDGHQVSAVDSGPAALAKIAAQEFDLALLDLNLKGMTGLQVLAELHQRWPDTVAIILTGQASLETAVETLRHGAHDYLFKPCRTIELRESVRTGLLKRQTALEARPPQPDSNRKSTSNGPIASNGPVTSNGPLSPTATRTLIDSVRLAPATDRFVQRGHLIVDAMQPLGGELTIEFQINANAGRVGIVFRDTGIGIDPAVLPNLFEPFFSTKETGMGLGLAICYDIVKRHDGQISAANRPGGGAMFSVWLPLLPG